jgi:hypothetical protein
MKKGPTGYIGRIIPQRTTEHHEDFLCAFFVGLCDITPARELSISNNF